MKSSSDIVKHFTSRGRKYSRSKKIAAGTAWRPYIDMCSPNSVTDDFIGNAVMQAWEGLQHPIHKYDVPLRSWQRQINRLSRDFRGFRAKSFHFTKNSRFSEETVLRGKTDRFSLRSRNSQRTSDVLHSRQKTLNCDQLDVHAREHIDTWYRDALAAGAVNSHAAFAAWIRS